MTVATKEFFTEPVQELEFLRPGVGLSEEMDLLLWELEMHGLVVGVGAHLSQQPHLAAMSQENQIREFCPDDIVKRFADETMMRGWQAKDTGRVMVGIYKVNGRDNRITTREIEGLTADDVTIVGYGWFGATPVNEMPPGVTITTAFRIGRAGQEVARQRSTPERRLRMGLALAKAVLGVAIEVYGIDRKRIGLESWRSNYRANGLYKELGFRVIASVMAERPTLEPAGSQIDGRLVLYKGARNEVWDERLFQVLATPEELAEMAREAETAGSS